METTTHQSDDDILITGLKSGNQGAFREAVRVMKNVCLPSLDVADHSVISTLGSAAPSSLSDSSSVSRVLPSRAPLNQGGLPTCVRHALAFALSGAFQGKYGLCTWML